MIGQTISHYKIIEKLGAGGMGVVYKAEDTRLKRIVALKFLPSSIMASETEKARFIHEAQAAAALNHPNICTIYEIDEVDGQAFIAMEFVEGESLKDKVNSNQLSVSSVTDIAIQIAQGLAKAHEHGITHRDIKSANVMITKDGIAKILDFGLAKLAGQSRLTKSGSTLGTMAYMSPEQARGEEVDHRTDIWALGVVLYEMLAGQLPFKGEYEHAVMYSILNQEPQPITSLRSEAPMELERVVNKALVKSPDERFQRVDEMLAAMKSLKREIESATVQEPRPLTKLHKRKRFYLYGGVAALLALLIGSGIYFGQNSAPRAKFNSIAVLPLDNLSGDPEQEYFADGMTEALITDLAQIEALKVISRTSVMHYKGANKPLPEIAKALNVDAVVDGSVQRFGERVKITAQLIEAATDRHLWAKSYERELRDILALQSELARAIANEIQIKLTPQEQARLTSTRQVNPEAHEALLKGLYYWKQFTEKEIKKSIEYFQQAITIDSTYALAYARLAFSYTLLASGNFIPPNEGYPKARIAAMKALEIDEENSEAYAALGFIKHLFDWDWAGAERDYKRAIALNQNNETAHTVYALYLSHVGRHDESIAEMKRAHELDPLSLRISSHLGRRFYLARRYDQAIDQFQKTLEIYPNAVSAHRGIGDCYTQKRIYNDAIAELKKANGLLAGDPETLGALGYTYAISDKKDEARKILDDLKALSQRRYVSPYQMAIVYLGLDDKEQAFQCLEKAYEVRSNDFVGWLKVDPRLDSLRTDPRFTALLKKVGL